MVVDQIGAFALCVAIVVAVDRLVLPVKLNLAVVVLLVPRVVAAKT